jgi:hypothetical protein
MDMKKYLKDQLLMKNDNLKVLEEKVAKAKVF